MSNAAARRESSQDSAALSNRILANQMFGSADLSHWLIEQLALRRDDTLLDVGCGTAVHLRAFARAIGRPGACTGVDVSASSLDIARGSEADSHLSLRLQALEMEHLDRLLPAHRFSLITAVYSLYYSRDTWDTLDQMRALLPEDGSGRIAIMGPYGNNNAEWFRFIGQFMSLPDRVRESTTTFMFDPVLRFATTHFGTIVCRRFVNRICIPSKSELERYWRSNVYYKEEYDAAFDACATRHFEENSDFTYSKVGQLVVMEAPIR